MKIAIDGPAGAGKSTIAKILAERLKCVYLDTGAMYRSVAFAALSRGADITNESEVTEVLNDIKIDVKYEGSVQNMYLNDDNISAEIRKPQISKAASAVSALRCVRIKMVELQRELSNRTDTVLDGRDIGTYVLPDADFKFFLTASAAERAKRRFKELCDKGMADGITLQQIQNDISERDYNDSHREFSPLKKADDAIEVDTTSMTIEQVTEYMLNIINGK